VKISNKQKAASAAFFLLQKNVEKTKMDEKSS
jgi:hypothetical protein